RTSQVQQSLGPARLDQREQVFFTLPPLALRARKPVTVVHLGVVRGIVGIPVGRRALGHDDRPALAYPSPRGTFRSRRKGRLYGNACANFQMRSVSGGRAAGFLKQTAQRGRWVKSCARNPSSIVARKGDRAISVMRCSRTLPSFCVPS